jgi:hypothetical protein
MKIILHLGFNKCGTTSLQHSLYNNRKLLNSYKIYYYFDHEYFKNSNKLYEAIKNNNNDYIQEFLNIFRLIEGEQYEKIILSCENFWYLYENDKLSILFDLFKDHEIELVLSVRPLRKIIYSYLTQLSSNGEILNSNNTKHISNYFLNALNSIQKYNFPISIVNLDYKFENNSNFIKEFYFSIMGVSNENIDNIVLNVSRINDFLHNLIVGQYVHMKNSISGDLINTEESDNYKVEYELYLSKLFSNYDKSILFFNEISENLSELFERFVNNLTNVKNIDENLYTFLHYFNNDKFLKKIN